MYCVEQILRMAWRPGRSVSHAIARPRPCQQSTAPIDHHLPRYAHAAKELYALRSKDIHYVGQPLAFTAPYWMSRWKPRGLGAAAVMGSCCDGRHVTFGHVSSTLGDHHVELILSAPELVALRRFGTEARLNGWPSILRTACAIGMGAPHDVAFNGRMVLRYGETCGIDDPSYHRALMLLTGFIPRVDHRRMFHVYEWMIELGEIDPSPIDTHRCTERYASMLERVIEAYKYNRKRAEKVMVGINARSVVAWCALRVKRRLECGVVF